MHRPPNWPEPRPLHELRAADLVEANVAFFDGGDCYRTTGEYLNNGGMGTVFLMERGIATGIEQVVGKTFHSKYLYQLRTDEITRREHQTTLNALERLRQLDHPHLLPTYISAEIADNHLFVTPRKADTLLEVVKQGAVGKRRRVELLLQTLDAMHAMHNMRIVHRDFTLRNVLLDADYENAYVFDFDLAMSLDDVIGQDYKTHYRGRIFGSPGFSVPPEILDPGLMECAITHRLDIYGIGGALFNLFTDQLPYGPTEDMWGLLVRIAEGVVVGNDSHIDYPDSVPIALRPIIERCLQRDPGNRYGSVGSIIRDIEACLDEIEEAEAADDVFHTTLRTKAVDADTRLDEVHSASLDTSVSRYELDSLDHGLARYGYQIEQALGRVKGHPIFQVVPDPQMLSDGSFPDENTFPKIVTVQHLQGRADEQEIIDNWFGRFLPVLHQARRGLMTSLYKAVYDEKAKRLFLFSEFVRDPRFGTQLDEHELTLAEALGLGYLVARQVSRLHEHGVAHNNVQPSSLLLKGLRDSRQVHPAMIGLVEPSIERAAIHDDVRQLALMTNRWIRPQRISAHEPRLRASLDNWRNLLLTIGHDMTGSSIDRLVGCIADGLALIDYNFGVLRNNGGNLDEYALLLVSHSLYGRLWE